MPEQQKSGPSHEHVERLKKLRAWLAEPDDEENGLDTAALSAAIEALEEVEDLRAVVAKVADTGASTLEEAALSTSEAAKFYGKIVGRNRRIARAALRDNPELGRG